MLIINKGTRMGAQVAVIVNDMAEVGIDAEAVRAGGGQIRQAAPRVVELSNGCICCTLRDDLLQVLQGHCRAEAASLSCLGLCKLVRHGLVLPMTSSPGVCDAGGGGTGCRATI